MDRKMEVVKASNEPHFGLTYSESGADVTEVSQFCVSAPSDSFIFQLFRVLCTISSQNSLTQTWMAIISALKDRKRWWVSDPVGDI